MPATTTAPSASAIRRELRGTSASSGRVTGTARVLHSADEAAVLRPGDILIVGTATPAWAALFPSIAGVISETGGVLSAFATLAREHHIPAVVGVSDAMAIIRDGDTVSLDDGRVVVHMTTRARAHAAA